MSVPGAVTELLPSSASSWLGVQTDPTNFSDASHCSDGVSRVFNIQCAGVDGEKTEAEVGGGVPLRMHILTLLSFVYFEHPNHTHSCILNNKIKIDLKQPPPPTKCLYNSKVCFNYIITLELENPGESLASTVALLCDFGLAI